MNKKNSILSVIILFIAFMFPGILFSQTPNTLSAAEKADGWQLLFNGNDLNGWHSYLEKEPRKAWQVHDGMIALNKNSQSVYADFADLVTDGEYENFDLKLEWKMEPCANSGVMFYVNESPQYKTTYETGPEMQITDLSCLYTSDHSSISDSRINMHRAGALYDLAPGAIFLTNGTGQYAHHQL